MKIAIVTDAWDPQVNGVVTTLRRTRASLALLGHAVSVFSPDRHSTIPCPTYPEIRLALWPRLKLARDLKECAPDAIHVATEGPLGLAAAAYCAAEGLAFTTSYHTQFPQYLRKRLPLPEAWTYGLLKLHHRRARRTLVATEQQRRDLVDRGFDNVVIWSRGVDGRVFRPLERDHLNLPRPIFMYMGRVAVEKNIDEFLSLDLPGTKVVVGDGPDREALEARYPQTVFLGYKFGVELALCLSAADAFVFPSRTDTFGLVMLEAMACGTPVAAYPVTGPIDVVTPGMTGTLDTDLRKAALGALAIDRQGCARLAAGCTWERASDQFLGHLVRAADGTDLVASASPAPLVPSSRRLCTHRERVATAAT